MSPPAGRALLVGALFLFASLSCSGPDAPPMAPAGKALAPPDPPTALTVTKSSYQPDRGGLLVTVTWTKPTSGTRFYNEYDAEYQYSFGTAEGEWTTFPMAYSRGDGIYAHFTIDQPVGNTQVKWRVRTSTDAGQSEWVEALFTIPRSGAYKTADDGSPIAHTQDQSSQQRSTPSGSLHTKTQGAVGVGKETIWSATLTVGQNGPVGSIAELGCQAKCEGLLTDREFSYGPTYYIESIKWQRLPNISLYHLVFTLAFKPGDSIPNSLKNALVLTVGSREFAWADAQLATERETNDGVFWDLRNDPLEGFEVGERVKLSLKIRNYDPSYPTSDTDPTPAAAPAPPAEPDLFPTQLDCHYPCEEKTSGGVGSTLTGDAFTTYMTENYGDDWQTECYATRCGSIKLKNGSTIKIE